MKKIKIPYINLLPILIIAFLLLKLIFTTELSVSGVLSFLYSCIAYFVWGFVLAYMLNPVLGFFETLIKSKKDTALKWKVKRRLVITFLYLLLAGIITIFVVAVIPMIRTGVSEITDNIPRYANNLEIWAKDYAGAISPEVSEIIENAIGSLSASIYNWLKGADYSSVGGALTSAVSSSAVAVIRFSFGVVISVYFLSNKENLILSIKRFIYAVFSKKAADKIIDTSSEVNSIFINFIVSKLVQSLILFLLGLLILIPIGIPFAPLIALVIAITNIIPYFGPYIGAVPSIIIVLFYSPWKAFWLLIFAIGAQIVDNLVIGPKIMSEQVGISPILVILGVTLGGVFGGILGMFLGVPVVAVIKLVFYDKFIERKLKEKEIDLWSSALFKIISVFYGGINKENKHKYKRLPMKYSEAF